MVTLSIIINYIVINSSQKDRLFHQIGLEKKISHPLHENSNKYDSSKIKYIKIKLRCKYIFNHMTYFLVICDLFK